MRVKAAILILTVIIAMCLSGCVSTSPSPTTQPSSQPSVQPSAHVAIKDFAFSPGEVTIPKGGTVTWANDDGTTHTVTFVDSSSPDLGNGATYSKTFNDTGNFSYKCSIHPSMTGKVIVI